MINLRLNHTSCILLSGALWLGIGLMLMTKGLQHVLFAAHPSHFDSSAYLLPKLAPITGGSAEAGLLVIVFGLFLGFIKGRWVLSKSVKRVVGRILALPSPLKLSEIYAKGYYFLILGMFGLGYGMKLIPLASDLKGLIDVAIGSALLNGSILYFRCALLKAKP